MACGNTSAPAGGVSTVEQRVEEHSERAVRLTAVLRTKAEHHHATASNRYFDRRGLPGDRRRARQKTAPQDVVAAVWIARDDPSGRARRYVERHRVREV